jgi:hypothetical protein
MLFKMKKSVEEKIMEGLRPIEKSLLCFVLTSEQYEVIQKKLRECKLDDRIHLQYYLAILSRALLDTLFRGFVPSSVLEAIFMNIEPELFQDNPLSYLYNHSLSIYTHVVDKIFEFNLAHTSF